MIPAGILAAQIGTQAIMTGIGMYMSGKERDKAFAALEEAQKIISELDAPPDTAKAIILDQFRIAGVENPELEKVVDVGVSQMAQYKEDPRLREAGMEALKKFQQQSETGLTAQDRLALRQIQQEQERGTQSKIAQIQQEAQMRGMGGSGSSLAAQLMSAQAGAERGLGSALQVGAQAQQGRMAALQQMVNTASGLRGADLTAAQATRGAADEFQRFRAQEAMARQARNITAMNEAQARNIARAQDVANRSVEQSTREKWRQAEAAGADADRRLRYAQAQADPSYKKSDVLSGGASAMAQGITQLGSGTSQAIGNAWDIYSKENTPQNPRVVVIKP